MPRQPTRFRRVILAVTLTMLAVVVAVWGVSYWRGIEVGRRVITSVSPPAIDRATQSWSCEGKVQTFVIALGSVKFEVTKYAHASSDPNGFNEELLAQQWKLYHLQAADFRPPQAPLAYWQGPSSWALLGCAYCFGPTRQGAMGFVVLHFWIVAAVVAGVAFGLWFPPLRLARRAARGQCPGCGYDFRGLAPGAPCPECGKLPKPTPPAT